MKYISVFQAAKKWGVSERSARGYCNEGRVPGAFMSGNAWNIPENAPIVTAALTSGPVSADILLTSASPRRIASRHGSIISKLVIKE